MARYEVPPESAQYVEELNNCVHDGLAGSDLSRMSILDLPVVWYSTGGSSEELVKAQCLTSIVRDVASHKLSGNDQYVVQALLGLEPFDGWRLTQRIDAITARLDMSWNQFRDSSLKRFLFRLVLVLSREGAQMWDGRHPDEYLRYAHNQRQASSTPSYRLKSYYISQRYVPGTVPMRRTIEVRTLIAVRETKEWRGSLRLPADSNELQPKVELFGDGALINGTRSDAREGYIRRFIVRFHRVALPGDERHFVLVRDRPLPTGGRYSAEGNVARLRVVPSVPIERLVVQVSFAAEQRPNLCWGIDGLPSDLESADALESTKVDLSTGSATVQFGHLRLGLAYGLGWEW